MIKKRRVLAAVVAALAGFGMVAPSVAMADPPSCVVDTSTIAQCFPDHNLALAVASGLYSGYTDPNANVNATFTSNRANGTVLNLDSRYPVGSLEGVQYLTKLENLQIQDSSVIDLAPIRSLSRLKFLSLRSIKPRTLDIAPVSGLSNLESLDINTYTINNFDALAGVGKFPKLKDLNLSADNLTNLNGLKDMHSLRALWLDGNHLDEKGSLGALAGVGRFPDLNTLSLQNTPISDPSAFKDLTNLQDLLITYPYSPITNMDWAKNLTNLKRLWVVSTSLANIDGLAGVGRFPNLEELRLHDGTMTNVNALKNLTSLKTLEVSNAKLTDVQGLKNLTGLTSLDLNGNQILDVDALSGLPAVTEMNLTGNAITDVSKLRSPKWSSIGYGSAGQKNKGLTYQQIALSSVDVKSSVQVRTAVDENGNYIQPSYLSPANGSYDSQTGLTTWSGLSAPGKVSIGFDKDVKVGDPSVNNGLVQFSGQIDQPYTLNGKDNSESVSSGAGTSGNATIKLPTPASVAPKFTQLTPANKGSLSVPSTVNAGSTYRFYTMNVTPAAKAKVDAGQPYTIYAFIYSDPVALTSDGHNTALQLKKDARGYYVDARIPDGYFGPHTIALVDPDGSIIGWSKVTVSAKGGATLATTGSSVSAIAVAGLLLLMAGAGFLLARRRV
ncbi:LPXTG cell wall anchor domain-containing protein [Bifidobacterium sp. ESL0690]|uniref:Ig-like domain-containing protein n=1 Tax=Bifidobacterium sp. ESL0690 TaxID=2983214 RepID=UPI0023F8E10E|nr:Ig-like domain-containing protein [Bifidobacterium sp. ESL0690]WEV47141.1 LPXTG cell wall anchor domain-containing protein [Bifidobacterium sp. ESL0690]